MKCAVCVAAVAALLACAAAATADFKLPDLKPFQKLRGFGLYSYTPAQLPCAYTASYTMFTDSDGTTVNADGYEARYQTHLSFAENVLYSSLKTTLTHILRSDIKEDGKPNSGSIFFGTNMSGLPGDSCSFEEYVDPFEDSYSAVSVIHYYITSSVFYETKEEDVEYNGENCTAYILQNDQTYSATYINSDGYVVGYIGKVVEPVSAYMELNVSYKMTAFEGQFKLGTSFEGCEDYSGIYSAPPKEDNCTLEPDQSDTSSSGPHGAAAHLVAAFAVIALSMAISLFF